LTIRTTDYRLSATRPSVAQILTSLRIQKEATLWLSDKLGLMWDPRAWVISV